MLQEWLRRFRLSGVPGAPATAGVPRDKTSSLEDELRPLLVQLGDAEQRTRAIEERFDTGNRRLLDDAKTSAEKLIAEARVRAGSERDRAIAEETAAAERERSDLLRDAEAEAGRVREQSARRARRPGRQSRLARSRRRGAIAVSASWVAAAVRARGLFHHRLGPDAIRELESASALADAVAALADSPYGRYVRRGMTLEQAERAVKATLLWHLRVLAGWGPALSATSLRLLAGPFEIENIEDLLLRFAGARIEPPFELGSLALSWPRLSTAASPGELRQRLTAVHLGRPRRRGPRNGSPRASPGVGGPGGRRDSCPRPTRCRSGAPDRRKSERRWGGHGREGARAGAAFARARSAGRVSPVLTRRCPVWLPLSCTATKRPAPRVTEAPLRRRSPSAGAGTGCGEPRPPGGRRQKPPVRDSQQRPTLPSRWSSAS